MTREEAIHFLKMMREVVDKFEEFGHDKSSFVIENDKAEAIDMAISALSIPIMEYPQVEGITPHLIDELSEKQVTSKLKKPCDSLFTEDSEDSKEQKSKLDLISRADAIKEIETRLEMVLPRERDEYDVGYQNGFERVIEIIEDMQSVSAERVGEWTARKTSLEFVCSNCGEACWRDFHYCPNCGARMEEHDD